jgi:hypothetical protein
MKHPVCRKAEDPALRDQEASQGIFRSALKWKTGSLYPPILAHFLHNLVVISTF